jgi:hypothetical protein
VLRQAQRRCDRCGCSLSQYNTDTLCAACVRSRTWERSTPTVPEHIWNDPDLRNALAAWDFGRASRLIRLRGGLRQDDMAHLTGLTSYDEATGRRLAAIIADTATQTGWFVFDSGDRNRPLSYLYAGSAPPRPHKTHGSAPAPCPT